MAIALALAGAVVYGIADFCGGLAARRAAVVAVLAASQLAGLVLLLPALALVPGRTDATAISWGAAAGVAGAVALGFFYRALAIGPMSVVAPLTAVCAAALPVVAGLALGERPSLLALVGIAGALVAIVLISSAPGDDAAGTPASAARSAPWTSSGVAGAIVAGVGFGAFFILLDRAADDTGLWPLAGARAASITLTLVAVAVTRPARPTSRNAVAFILGCGVGDMAANVLFLLATREGLLSLAAVLTSLYPASTVLLAQLVLGERLSARQAAGLGAAAVAVALIALP